MSSAIVSSINSKSFSGFNPRSIPSCDLWLDGTDPNGTGIAPSDGASITTWVDKSGSGNNLSAAGTGTPTYASATKNISYGGTSWLQKTGMTISPTFTFFAVARKTSGNGPVFTNTTTTDRTGFFPNYSAQTYLVKDDGTWLVYSSTFSNETTHLYSITYDSSSNINLWGNGSLFATNTQSGTITRDSILIGKRNVGGGENWTGTFSEILQYSITPTTAQRQQIEGYLAQKWGLTTNLPAAHSFKSLPLFTRFFQPTDIDNCVLWLDGADRSAFTLSGTSITQWRDKTGKSDTTSGGTYNAIGTLGNGLSTVSISNTYIYTTNQIGISGVSPQTYVVVANTGDTVNYFNMLHWATSSSGNAYTSSVILSISRDTVTAGINQVGNNISITGITQTKTKLAITTHTGSLASIFESGTAGATSTNTLNQTNGNIRIGIGTSTAEIGELIVFNRALSTSERQQLEGYLAWKWNLRGNLPSTQPFRLFRTPTVATNPLQVPNCYMWIDALDSSTVTLTGGNVTEVADKSGNGRNLSNGTGYTYNQTKFNSIYPSFYNIGGAPRSIGKNTSFTGLAQPITIFVVGQVIFVAAEPFPFLMDGPDGAGRIGPYWASSTQLAFFGGGSLNYTGTFSSPYIFCFTANTTSSQIIHNGSIVATGNIGTNTLNGIILGSRFADTTYTGHICEFIMYNRLLTSSEIRVIEGHLAWKWGLKQNLYTGHPHYNAFA